MRTLADRSLKRTSVNFSLAKLIDDNIDELAKSKGYLNKNHYVMQLLINDNGNDKISDTSELTWNDLQDTIVKTVPA
jgi:hypothetical protein